MTSPCDKVVTERSKDQNCHLSRPVVQTHGTHILLQLVCPLSPDHRLLSHCMCTFIFTQTYTYKYIHRDIFIQLHSSHFGDFGMGDSAVQRGNLGRERGCMWHQPGADIVPVAPLAAPAPSVICVNICKPKVPLSPNVRAVCLAFPLRKPGVIHQYKTY